MKTVSKKLAVARLQAHGLWRCADCLDGWRSRCNTNQGWDGHVRRVWPHLVAVIWTGGTE